MNQEPDDRYDNEPRFALVRVERDHGYGSVPGLEDEELADPAELERQAMLADWGPILALPVKPVQSRIRPTYNQEGNPDWGAFGTRDYELMYGPVNYVNKPRYKAEKLDEEVRNAVSMLGMISARLPAETVNALQAKLRDNSLDPDSLDNADEFGFARWYTRIKRLRTEVRELRQFMDQRRE